MSEFKKGDIVKFKSSIRWMYGIVDEVFDDHCEVSYSSKVGLSKFLRRDGNLDYFGSVDKINIVKAHQEFDKSGLIVKPKSGNKTSMSEFKVGCSPITDVIYAGTVKNGIWQGQKHDITEDAVSAVAQLLLKTDTYLKFKHNGEEYVLKVQKLNRLPTPSTSAKTPKKS